MRVIAGSAKGRRLLPVPGDTTRPTTDRVKESLFSILQLDLPEADFLDLFSGSGAIAIEALSRGARFAWALDVSAKATEVIKKNLESCSLETQAEVRKTDAFTYLRNTSKSFDLMYIDPPQFKNLWLEALQTIAERPNLLNQNAKIIVKMHPKEYEEFSSNILEEYRQEKYGNSLLLFFHQKLNIT